MSAAPAPRPTGRARRSPVAGRARAGVPRARGFGVAALDGAARARRAASARVLRVSPPAAAICGMLARRGGCRARGAQAGRGRRRARRARARAARRRRRRRAAAPRPLGRAGVRASAAASQALPGVRVPVPRARRVDAHRDPARRHGAGRRRRRSSRSGRGAAELGLPRRRARCCSSTLYAIPAVALDFENEFLRGAAARAARARLPAAREAAGRRRGQRRRCSPSAVACSALMLAPALDTDQPWFDYESWALDAASAKSTVVLLGPHLRAARLAARRPRAAARAGAKRPAYWKADEPRRRSTARRWVRERRRRPRRLRRRPRDPQDALPARHAGDPRHDPQPRAAHSSSPPARRARSTRRAIRETPRGDGTCDAPAARCAAATPTRRIVYTPQTDEARAPRRRRRTAPRADLARFTRACSLPRPAPRSGRPGAPLSRVQFPHVRRHGRRRSARAGGQPAAGARPGRAPRAAPAARTRRTYALAQRLKRGASETQEDYVQAVLRYLRRRLHLQRVAAARGRRTSTASCSTPRPATASSTPARWRCCCGWAASPRASSTGFTSGSLDRQDARVRRARPRRPLVGRGLVPGHRLGHVRPDAGRRAAALAARTRAARAARRSAAAAPPSLGGDRPSDPAARAAAVEQGTPWALIALAGVGAVLAARLAACARGCAPAPPRGHAAGWRSARRARARAATARAAHPGRGRRRCSALEATLRPHARGRRLRARGARAALRRPAAARRRRAQRRGAARRAGPRRRPRRAPARVVGAARRAAAVRSRVTLGRSDGRRVRPLQARHGAARGGGLQPGHGPAVEGRATSSRRRPRSARRSAGRTSARASSRRRASSSRRSSSARRRTTSRCSASAAR